MFDRANYTTIGSGPTYVTKTVTEHRAPTDESVRLLKEMEEKAREKIIDSFSVKDTHFECKFFQEMDMTTQEMKYVVIYSMNGKRRTVDVRVERDAINLDTYKKLINAVAYDIAGAILSDAFSKAVK
jgi:methylphosphotriester-DNA--protein-cysteine methyltransferase